MSDLRICIDLPHAERNAIAVREMLIALSTKYALGPYEYCKEVCIAPGVLPYSHPVIKLHTALFTETALLANFIHEQMHWYVTWYSHKHTDKWRSVRTALEYRHPDPPIGRMSRTCIIIAGFMQPSYGIGRR